MLVLNEWLLYSASTSMKFPHPNAKDWLDQASACGLFGGTMFISIGLLAQQLLPRTDGSPLSTQSINQWAGACHYYRLHHHHRCLHHSVADKWMLQVSRAHDVFRDNSAI